MLRMKDAKLSWYMHKLTLKFPPLSVSFIQAGSAVFTDELVRECRPSLSVVRAPFSWQQHEAVCLECCLHRLSVRMEAYTVTLSQLMLF